LLVTYFQRTPGDWNTKPTCSFKKIVIPTGAAALPTRNRSILKRHPTRCLPKTIDFALTLETIPFSIVIRALEAGMIKVQHLVKTFGDFPAVRDISFEVAQGEIFAFLGPNGAGKTTTIKMLTTLLQPTSGGIELDGLDPRTSQKEARKRFGIVFQDPRLDAEQTAYENMTLHGVLYHVPRQLRETRTEYLLKLFELWDRRDSYVKTFSGGMRRRLEIARGLLHTPRILFLDEPTLGLDPQSRNLLWNHVKHLNETERTTVFLTTHYMDEAERVAHRIAIIDHGAIVAQGTPAELKQQTATDSLEGAFLALTGSTLRDEAASSADQLRQVSKMWRK
jgi:ABC-2 type transport system ATP-binding protein